MLLLKHCCYQKFHLSPFSPQVCVVAANNLYLYREVSANDLTCLRLCVNTCVRAVSRLTFLLQPPHFRPQFCIMEQMHVYGQRLPGEPMIVGMFQVSTLCNSDSTTFDTSRDSTYLPRGLSMNATSHLQAANVLHDAFEEPGQVLWRKVRWHVIT